MQTVKLFKVTCTKAYEISGQGTRFSLAPWGKDTFYYEGYDDGGADYILPEGYTVAETVCGDLSIYDKRNWHCPICSAKNTPFIYDDFGNEIYLKKVI